jgi:uroporphyrinogen-III synthase
MRVLVTRPKGKGEALSASLDAVADSVHHQPIIQISATGDVADLPRRWDEQTIDILIFVSGFAVEHFICGLKTPLLLESSNVILVAVGRSTADKLRQWTSKPVICPDIETSEGLLALPSMQKAAVEGNNIVIVRGVDGRELLAQELQSRQAQVDYWQLYQRLPIIGQGDKWFVQWQSAQINCIVVTSVAILTTIFEQLPDKARDWLISLSWIVPSERIAVKAQALGINPKQIHDAKGASNEAVLAQLKRIIEKQYVK